MTALAFPVDRDNERIVLAKSPRRSLWLAFLRVPLLGKVLGANLLIDAAAIAGHYLLPATSSTLQFFVLLLVSFVVTGLLVWIALRPIAQLEATAERVTTGDFSARVPDSVVADKHLARLAATMNRLLDRVATDRARIQYLAGRSVRARDVEREAVARELRESFAQTLSGISMQLSAMTIAAADEPVRARQLQGTRELVQQLADDVRSVAETLYPGTLGEFGLVNAIDALARRITRRSTLRVTIDAGGFNIRMSNVAASALYRVTEEALRNIEQHANATHARVVLRSNGVVTLSVEDDGRGVDMRMSDPLQAGLGLFSAKAVLALAGGELQISSAPGLGTHVVAKVPATVAPETQ